MWKEFHDGKEDQDAYEKPLFSSQKNNLRKNHSTPELLKSFLASVRSEISGPRNRNQAKCNLPVEELAALKDLINLQKNKKIVIKACDKGAGILILDFNDYLKACYQHLTSELSPGNPYYTEVNTLDIERARTKIKGVLQQALDENIITNNEP